MHLKEIKELIEILHKSDITKLQIRQDGFELRLDKSTNSDAPPMPPMPACPPSTIQIQAPPIQASLPQPDIIVQNDPACKDDFITSPMVGTFYHCPSPGAAPFVKAGDMVKKGQVVGIVEAMKIMNEIEAEFDCRILSIETPDATPVEFSTKLLKVQRLS